MAINLNNIFRQVAKGGIRGRVTFPGGNPVQGVKRYTEELGRTVSAIVRETTFLIQRDAKKTLGSAGPSGKPVSNLGILRDSVKVDFRGEGATIQGYVFVGKDYGVWVEFGRRGLKTSPKGTRNGNAARAAWPPRLAILQWVKERKLRVSGGLGRDKKTGQFKSIGSGQEGIAFLIQRKIALHGIAPQPFLMPAYKRHIRDFRERLVKAVKGIRI